MSRNHSGGGSSRESHHRGRDNAYPPQPYPRDARASWTTEAPLQLIPPQQQQPLRLIPPQERQEQLRLIPPHEQQQTQPLRLIPPHEHPLTVPHLIPHVDYHNSHDEKNRDYRNRDRDREHGSSRRENRDREFSFGPNVTGTPVSPIPMTGAYAQYSHSKPSYPPRPEGTGAVSYPYAPVPVAFQLPSQYSGYPVHAPTDTFRREHSRHDRSRSRRRHRSRSRSRRRRSRSRSHSRSRRDRDHRRSRSPNRQQRRGARIETLQSRPQSRPSMVQQPLHQQSRVPLALQPKESPTVFTQRSTDIPFFSEDPTAPWGTEFLAVRPRPPTRQLLHGCRVLAATEERYHIGRLNRMVPEHLSGECLVAGFFFKSSDTDITVREWKKGCSVGSDPIVAEMRSFSGCLNTTSNLPRRQHREERVAQESAKEGGDIPTSLNGENDDISSNSSSSASNSSSSSSSHSSDSGSDSGHKDDDNNSEGNYEVTETAEESEDNEIITSMLDDGDQNENEMMIVEDTTAGEDANFDAEKVVKEEENEDKTEIVPVNEIGQPEEATEGGEQATIVGIDEEQRAKNPAHPFTSPTQYKLDNDRRIGEWNPLEMGAQSAKALPVAPMPLFLRGPNDPPAGDTQVLVNSSCIKLQLLVDDFSVGLATELEKGGGTESVRIVETLRRLTGLPMPRERTGHWFEAQNKFIRKAIAVPVSTSKKDPSDVEVLPAREAFMKTVHWRNVPFPISVECVLRTNPLRGTARMLQFPRALNELPLTLYGPERREESVRRQVWHSLMLFIAKNNEAGYLRFGCIPLHVALQRDIQQFFSVCIGNKTGVLTTLPLDWNLTPFISWFISTAAMQLVRCRIRKQLGISALDSDYFTIRFAGSDYLAFREEWLLGSHGGTRSSIAFTAVRQMVEKYRLPVEYNDLQFKSILQVMDLHVDLQKKEIRMADSFMNRLRPFLEILATWPSSRVSTPPPHPSISMATIEYFALLSPLLRAARWLAIPATHMYHLLVLVAVLSVRAPNHSTLVGNPLLLCGVYLEELQHLCRLVMANSPVQVATPPKAGKPLGQWELLQSDRLSIILQRPLTSSYSLTLYRNSSCRVETLQGDLVPRKYLNGDLFTPLEQILRCCSVIQDIRVNISNDAMRLQNAELIVDAPVFVKFVNIILSTRYEFDKSHGGTPSPAAPVPLSEADLSISSKEVMSPAVAALVAPGGALFGIANTQVHPTVPPVKRILEFSHVASALEALYTARVTVLEPRLSGIFGPPGPNAPPTALTNRIELEPEDVDCIVDSSFHRFWWTPNCPREAQKPKILQTDEQRREERRNKRRPRRGQGKSNKNNNHSRKNARKGNNKQYKKNHRGRKRR